MTYQKTSEWVIKETSEDIKKYKNINVNIAKLLSVRGIDADETSKFLEPKLASIYPCEKLYNSQKSAKKIIKAINENKKIYIHGDFDSDGICATTILWEFLYKDLSEHFGVKVDVLPFIPNRQDDGYGLSENTLTELINNNANLIITVDCGVRDLELVKKYKDIDFIITDHHQPPEDLKVDSRSSHLTLVHPMYPKHEYPFQNISGTFVAFLLIQEIKKECGLDYSIKPETKGLDLVALSTVTDIMPLLDINRVAVKYGLEQIKKTNRVGLKKLVELSGISIMSINSYHLGYVVGPRINAVGRIGDPMDGVRLLSTGNYKKASELANKVNELNKKRQEITNELIIEAETQIIGEEKLIMILGEEWPEGIIGLIAGKLMEKYHKPTIVMSKKTEIRGSARSLGGFNITNALDSVSEYLEKYGGHSEAAGFTVGQDKFEIFQSSLISFTENALKDKELKKEKNVDLKIDTSKISLDLLMDLKKLEPYGHKNYRPIFQINEVVVIDKKVLGNGNKHLKLKIKGDGLELLECVLFDCQEDIEIIQIDDVLNIIGNLDLNEWSGITTIQFNIIEWEKVR